ncbi:MAG: hypothetical protein KGH64_04780 [Candidatus Micrarchaeota archaeon]|nr:hypothetical protein [Candidatus Micrarchaeota archaeon]MDE1834627.1 hypothetical protein [Candidatus Micrarchaeota archaeon]MDE1859058.1 hypothetical protein [Candidatus Micrarchaeota archaeon]
MQRIVVPGEKLSEKQLRIENTITDANGTYSCILGSFDEQTLSLIPLEGLWQPRNGDTIIGIVEEDRGTTVTVNLNAPYKGLIISKFLESEIKAGDIIVSTIKELEKGGTAILIRPKVLGAGKLMSVTPSKIPRIIGKANTMVKQITDGTGTSVVIGLNGLVWLSGGDVDLATAAILKIEEEAHTSGLTERVKELLDNKKMV